MVVDWSMANAANITFMPVAICHAVLGLHLLLVSKNSIHSCPDESNVQLAFFDRIQPRTKILKQKAHQDRIVFIFSLKTVLQDFLGKKQYRSYQNLPAICSFSLHAVKSKESQFIICMLS